jgi:hypothetical protein
MKVFTVFTASIISLATAAPLSCDDATNFTVGQVVETSSGPVAGHAAAGYTEVSEYLGIPFGQAPVRNLRFAAPVKYTSTSLTNASTYVCFPALLLDVLEINKIRVPRVLVCQVVVLLLRQPMKSHFRTLPLLD